jgi:hypothetical protein
MWNPMGKVIGSIQRINDPQIGDVRVDERQRFFSQQIMVGIPQADQFGDCPLTFQIGITDQVVCFSSLPRFISDRKALAQVAIEHIAAGACSMNCGFKQLFKIKCFYVRHTCFVISLRFSDRVG